MTARLTRRAWRRLTRGLGRGAGECRSSGLAQGRNSGGEAGFTVVESVMALSVIFVVLVSLLAGLTAGIRGLVAGRQRGAALAVANEVLEQARSRGYAEVGHDLDSDPTLGSDPMLTGAGAARSYTGVSPAEPLAASTVDAGPTAGTSTNPLFPFSPHQWTIKREASTYAVAVYVTGVTPVSGDAYKRITVKVDWTPTQYTSSARTITLSTLLFNVVAPADPHLVGSSEADAGSFVVTGSLAGTALGNARLTLPYVTGEVDSGFLRSAKGFATTGRSSLALTAGSPTGCVLDGTGLSADCTAAKAAVGADNDAGTAPPETDHEGPVTSVGGAIVVPGLSAFLGAGTAEALATARSCWTCSGSGPDDNDGLPYLWTRATGPANLSVGFKTGTAEGSLLSALTGCVTACATAVVDRDDVGGSARLQSTASAAYPALDLVTFAGGAPAGYAGMVRLGAASVSAGAQSGPGAAPPSASGAPVAVQLYNNAGGYTTVTVNPGAASPATDPSAHAAFSVNGALVTMDATVHWNPTVVSSTGGGGVITESRASLTNWLSVEVHLVITEGTSISDLVLHLDYGRLSALATYEAM